MQKVVPGPFAKKSRKCTRRLGENPPATPRGCGTTPGRYFHGRLSGARKVDWGTEGARCRACGRHWNGCAQCGCSPEYMTPDTQGPTSPVVAQINEWMRPFTESLRAGRSPLRLSDPTLRRLREGAGRLGFDKESAEEETTRPPLLETIRTLPRDVSPTQAFSVMHSISPTQPFSDIH
jgi:hypothetical protein